MIELIFHAVNDPRQLAGIFAAIAAVATVLTLGMPLLANDPLEKRMKAVATERSKIRARERERLARGERKGLKREPKAYMQNVVSQFNLAKHLGTEDAKERLQLAGYRGPGAMTAFLFFRMVVPIGFLVVSLFYLFLIEDFGQSALVRVGAVVFATYLGVKAPELFLKNQTQKRQTQMRRAFPDALDLMLICVESGMSVEAAFRKVADEIGSQSVALAEELTLTMAEMSYLQDRRTAYENFGARTGLDSVKSVGTALIQADKYGTPVSQALRVLAQDSRDTRMSEAEKKAAGLPPKLTVPMILFFLPVIFVVILGPAYITVMAVK
ncbi:type II secretion system F family protein [Hansschlegelia zhihuaiae]|uniref:Type II secretion system F family protein n=1 Tax=Hansschlegelia zhihuaiae TaxID=405005 RepID=A0A4Q0MJA0_9HYPH|nr:type II secretion system F family protein [Hansschlegelia zhihuaiae]RXF73640.1 type II secretion system F family protein [Hansschlegelia zhihuaiae]